MNYLNDSNWTGRIARSLAESKWGPYAHLDGHDNEARPTRWDVLGIICGIGMLALFCYVGPTVFA